jgi:hypothetical protein
MGVHINRQLGERFLLFRGYDASRQERLMSVPPHAVQASHFDLVRDTKQDQSYWKPSPGRGAARHLWSSDRGAPPRQVRGAQGDPPGACRRGQADRGDRSGARRRCRGAPAAILVGGTQGGRRRDRRAARDQAQVDPLPVPTGNQIRTYWWCKPPRHDTANPPHVLR